MSNGTIIIMPLSFVLGKLSRQIKKKGSPNWLVLNYYGYGYARIAALFNDDDMLSWDIPFNPENAIPKKLKQIRMRIDQRVITLLGRLFNCDTQTPTTKEETVQKIEEVLGKDSFDSEELSNTVIWTNTATK